MTSREISAPETTVVVGMSGGVDSAVAALLLKEQGYRVVGLFMKNWDDDDGTEYCTAAQDLLDADQVCHRLGIELHTVNFAAEYRETVFAEFLREYAAGRTPNPDVLCNREIKFRQFVDHARTLGADHIATGHYVRLERSGGNVLLKKGRDESKDQSYFLQAVPRADLACCLFPLGDLQKHDVRLLAERAGFLNHRKKDSTGICFIGERRFTDFLARYLPKTPGPIRDLNGARLGEHQGLAYYTIGQRQGLGVGGLRSRLEAPWYVVDKRLATNTLIVAQHTAALAGRWLAVGDVNWLVDPPGLPFRAAAKIRYRQSDQPCQAFARADGCLGIRFDAPQRAISPGQYVCLYDGDVCMGGGVILGREPVGSAAPATEPSRA